MDTDKQVEIKKIKPKKEIGKQCQIINNKKLFVLFY